MVTALGKTYHQNCFACARCKTTFVYGEKVIYTKNQCVCTHCIELEKELAKSPAKEEAVKKAEKKVAKKEKSAKPQTKSTSLPLFSKKSDAKREPEKISKDKEIKNSLTNSSNVDKSGSKDKIDLSSCAGCNKSLSRPPILHQPRSTSRASGRSVQIQDHRSETPENTTLFALNRHWHEGCFRCSTCETPLFNKEYMTSKVDTEALAKSKDEPRSKLMDSPEHQMTAHCMTCYKAKLSVRCSHCSRTIEGKVLQAGDLHFHPTCCRCFKCGNMFTHQQELLCQGKAIWHAECEGLRFDALESHVSVLENLN